MKSVHFQLPDPPLPFPFGYTYNTKIDTNSNNSESNTHQRQNTQQSKNDYTFSHLPLDQQQGILEKKQTIEDSNKNSNIRYSFRDTNIVQEVARDNQNFKFIPSNYQDLGSIKMQLQKQIARIKYKVESSGRIYQELLQKLISILSQYQDKDIGNLIFDYELNSVIFQIRALPNLEILYKTQFEEIINAIFKQEEKLYFQELVREATKENYMYWMEPLYYEVKKRQLPKSDWKQFIQSQITLYNI